MPIPWIVYTCQKPQPTRCDFFLWEDDAKSRETAVLLDNARSEPSGEIPHRKPDCGEHQLLSRKSKPLSKVDDIQAPEATGTLSRAPNNGSAMPYPIKTDQADSWSEEVYSKQWSPSKHKDGLENLGNAARNERMSPPETPKRPIMAASVSTSGKRKAQEMLIGSSEFTTPSPSSSFKGDDADVFSTSNKSKKMTGLFASHVQTPSPIKFRDGSAELLHPAQLSTEIYSILQRAHVTIPAEAEGDISELCRRQVLHMQGLVQGRDLSRKGIIQKQEKITELQNIIQGLQAERESARAVIRHLRIQSGAVTANKASDEYIE